MAIGLENLLEQAITEALSYGIGGALTPTLAPLTQAVQNRVWPLDPNIPTDPATAARLALTGRRGADAMAIEAAKAGVGPDAFADLLDAGIIPIDFGALIQLRQRGEIDEAQLDTALRRLGVEPALRPALKALTRDLLSVADLAMARQQGFIDAGEQQTRSQLLGIEAPDAELLFELAGLPPGVTEGLELLRRGQIDEARFAQYVREGHTKTKYIPDLLNLRYQPLSASVAAEALIRERISQPEAVAIAAKNGINEADFLLWSNMMGRPMGTHEALTLVNRGQMTTAEFREVVARSDVRTEYVDHLLELRFHYPTLFQVERALQSGQVTDELARDTLTKEGYTPEWVDAIIAAGHKAKTATHKDIALSVIQSLYDAGLEDEPHALKLIESLGYDENEAGELLLLYEARRLVTETTAALTIVRNHYVNHQITENQALADLDDIPARASTKAKLLDRWRQERAANVKTLTAGQIGQALKYERFTVEQAIARWITLGYSAEDAETLAWITEKGPPHPQPAP